MSAFEQNVKVPQERPRLFWNITRTWLVLLLITIVWGVFNWTATPQQVPIIGEISFSYGKLAIAIAIAWLILSVTRINEDEVAAVLFLGLPLIKVNRGPKIVIAGVLSLRRFTATVIQNQFPAEPELIQKTPDEVPLRAVEVTLPDGSVVKKMSVRPIRITTAAPRENVTGILNVQMTVEFTFWTRWIIVDPFRFIVSVGGDEDSAISQLRDLGESFLTDKVTEHTPAELIDDFGTIQREFKAWIQDGVKDWGIAVLDVGLTAPDINHDVAAALRNIPVAKAQAEQTIIDANAKGFEIERLGKAKGVEAQELLAGQGRGYKDAAAATGLTPAEILAADVARATVGEGDLVLGAEGIAQAIGLGKAILKTKE